MDTKLQTILEYLDARICEIEDRIAKKEREIEREYKMVDKLRGAFETLNDTAE